MRRDQTPDDTEVIDFIKLGITPRALEAAHKAHTVRELGKRCDANQHCLKALALRWNIGYSELC